MIYDLRYRPGYSGSAAEEVAEEVVTLLNDHQFTDIDEAIGGVLDNWLIWTDNQWNMMKEYQTPEEADYQAALEDLINDIYSLIEEEEEEDEEGITIEDEDGGKYIIDVEIIYQDAEEKQGAVYYGSNRLGVDLSVMSGYSFESYLKDEAGEAEKEEIINEIKEIEEERQKEIFCFFIIDAYKSFIIEDIKSTLKEHPEITAEDVKEAAEAAEALDEPAIEDLVMIIEEIQEEGGSSIC